MVDFGGDSSFFAGCSGSNFLSPGAGEGNFIVFFRAAL